MGSDVHVVVVGDAELLGVARARIHQLEQRWSRFLPTSELSLLNAAAGRDVSVSPDTMTLVRACATAWAATDGRFDPALGHVMLALGYDRDFAMVASGPACFGESWPTMPRLVGMDGVVIDERAGTVRVPPGVGLDGGGLGKGLAADMVLAELEARRARGALVNIGGDLAASGEPPDGEAWVVRVEDPFDAERTLCRVALVRGGIATSSTLGRRWTVDATEVHHVIDPTTERPTTGRLVAATVVAGQAWWAESLTKSILVGGRTVPLPASSALVVDVDGHAEVLGDRPRVPGPAGREGCVVDGKLWWYLARSSGMVAWLVLVATVVWGALLAGRLVARPGAPRWLTDVHRHLGGLAVALIGLHIAALVADSYVQLGWADVLVPFASSWKPGAVAWGVVALYLLAIVEVTSLLQRRLPRRWWRAIHFSSYLLFWMATMHGITAGTDAQAPAFRVGVALAVTATTFAVVARILSVLRSPRSRRSAASAARPAPVVPT